MGYKLKYRASEINTLLDVVKNDVMDKNLVEKSQLTQSDASEWDDTKLSYIKNRTHYEEARTFTAPFELGVPHGVVGEITIIYADQEASVNIGESIRLTSTTGGIVTITYSDTGVIFATESEPSITEDSPITVKYCKPLDEKFLPSSVATKDDIIKTYKTDFTVFDLIELANGRIDGIAISKDFYEAVLRGDVIVVGTSDAQGGNIAGAECSVMEDYTRIRLSLIFRYSWLEALITVDNASMEGNVDFAICHNLQGLLVDGENFSTINGQSLLRGGDIVVNEPYLAPFSMRDLEGPIAGYMFRFPKDEFIEAVTAGRPLVVPIHNNDRSGITASYYLTPATAETGKGIVVDILHSSKVYHLTLEDGFENDFFILSPNNVSCKDLGSNTFVVPYTFNEIQSAANKKTTLPVDVDFVDAVNSKKLILIPTGKTVAEGQYISAFNTIGNEPDSSVSISLGIFYGTRTVDIRFSSKSQAPTAANVTFAETPLLTEKLFLGIYNGDSTHVTKYNTEFTVNSIDGASFTNNGKTTAMTPNTVYNFVNNGVNRTIAVYDDHRVVITSENNSTVALSPGVTYTSRARIIPSALPSSLVTKPELREAIQDNQADWSAKEGNAGYVKNRTHYYATYQYPQIGQRFMLAVGPNLPFHSLSDFRVFLNDKFYKFDDSASVGDTMDFGVGEKQMVSITVLDITTSGTTTNYTCQFSGQNGLMPDSYGRVAVQIVRKSKTLDPIYLPEMRGDWGEMDANSLTFIKNKTHFAPVYYQFRVGERISLIEDKVNHTIDNYRVKYEDKLYALPTELGGEVYIPSAADWKFKVAYELYDETDTKSIYSLNSYVNPDITLENASVEIITDLPGLGGKKLDEFYISEDIARVGTTEDDSSKNSIFGAKRYSDEQRRMLINEYMNVKPTVRIFHSTNPDLSSIYAYHPYFSEFGDGELVVMRYGKTRMAKWVLDGDERSRKHVTKTGWRECLGAPTDLKYYVGEQWKDARFTDPAKLYVGQNDYMTVLEEICARATYEKINLVSDDGAEYDGLVSMAQLMARYDTDAIQILQTRFYDWWENYYYGDAENPPEYSIFGGNRNRVTLGIALRILNPEFQKLLDEGILDTDHFNHRHWYYDIDNNITIPKYLYSDVCEMYLSKGSMREMIDLDLPRVPRLSLK